MSRLFSRIGERRRSRSVLAPVALIEHLERRALAALDGFVVDATYGNAGRATVGAVTSDVTEVKRMLRTSSGKLIVLAHSFGTNAGYLTQLLPDGTLDASFGSNGISVLTEFATNDEPFDMAIDANGRIIVQQSEAGLKLRRYLENGTYDPTFVAPTNADGFPAGVSVAPDGKYYAINGTTIHRLLATGAADTSFDNDGQITIPQEPNYIGFAPFAVQPLANGSLLVGGRYGSAITGIRNVAVRMYDASGQMNATFGTLQIGYFGSDAFIDRFLLQTDGKVLARVRADNAVTGGLIRLEAPSSAAPGALDQGFASLGIFDPVLSAMDGFALDSTGRIYGATNYTSSSTLASEEAIFRLTPSGAPDPTFGNSNGYQRSVFVGNASLITWGPYDLVLNESTSRLYTITAPSSVASGEQPMQIERFLLTGVRDTAFASAGKLLVAPAVDRDEDLRSSVLLSDGSVVFAGSTGLDKRGFVGKVNANGSPSTWGPRGVTTVEFGSNSSTIFAVAASPNSKVVVAGTVATFSNNTWITDYALARLNADGSLDTTFDGDGKRVSAFGGDAEAFTHVRVDGTNSSIFAAGWYATLGLRVGAVVKHLSTGAIDTTFGTSGIRKLNSIFTSSTDIEITGIEVVSGKVIVSGGMSTGSTYEGFILRLGTNGALDTTFGSGGSVRFVLDTASSGASTLVYHAASGRFYRTDFVNGGPTGTQMAIRKLTLAGQYDATWGTAGIALMDVRYDRNYGDLTVLADGRLRLFGRKTVSSLNSAPNRIDLTFTGLRANGSIDPEFGVNGEQTMNVGRWDLDAQLHLTSNASQFIAVFKCDPNGRSPDVVTMRLKSGYNVVPPELSTSTSDVETGRRIVLNFSKDVLASLQHGDFTLERQAGWTTTTVPPSLYVLSASNVNGLTRAVLTLDASVPDGYFTASIPPEAIADVYGIANTTWLRTTTFAFLRGDANKDGRVNFDDLLVLAANYNTTGKVFSQGDFNYDGAVNFDDLLILASRYNQFLSASPTTPPPGILSGAPGKDDDDSPPGVLA
jgi:uncharacterized delta-60 repeat protein